MSDFNKRDSYNNGYNDGYNDGFDRGGEAVVQQIDGILYSSNTSIDAVMQVKEWIEDFWKERES